MTPIKLGTAKRLGLDKPPAGGPYGLFHRYGSVSVWQQRDWDVWAAKWAYGANKPREGA